jgi:hypothetical protein
VVPRSEIRRLDVQRGTERNAKTALRYTVMGIGAGFAAVFTWDAIRSRSNDGFGNPKPPYPIGVLGGAGAGFLFSLSREHRRWVAVQVR